MKGWIILLIAAALLVAAWSWFLAAQNQELQKEDHAADYIFSAFAVLAIVMAAAGFGIRLRGSSGSALTDMLAGCAIGLALLAAALLALTALGWLRPYAVWILVAAMGGVSYRQIGSLLRRLVKPEWPGGSHLTGAVAGFLIAAAVAVCLIACLAPLTANDALVYHLNVPKIYASDGGLTRLPYNVYANMPHYGEILYTLFFTVSGETGAKIFYLFLFLAAGGAVYSLGRRFVGAAPAAIGAVCFLVQPLILDHRVVCNVDVLLAYFYIVSVLLALELTDGGRGLGHAAGLGLLAGFMLGVKYTALVPCLTLLLILALAKGDPNGATGKRGRAKESAAAGTATTRKVGAAGRAVPRNVAIAVLIALIVFSPWLIKSQVHVGNPLYPMFEQTFDGDSWDEVQSGQLVAWQRSMGMGRSLKDYLMLPLNVSIRGKPGLNYTRFDGTITPLLLCLLPFALLRRRRRTTLLIVMAAAGFVFWALTSQQLRFLIPTLALASVLAAVGVDNLSRWTGGRAMPVVAVLALVVQVSGLVAPDQYGRPFLASSLGDRLPVAAGTETRQSHLERSIQSFGMFEHVNTRLPQGEPVFLVWENRGYYLDRPYFADSFFEASTLMRLVAASGDPGTLRGRIEEMGYRYVVVNEMLGGFFSRAYPPRDVAVLNAFLESHLRPLHTSNRLTLYELQ